MIENPKYVLDACTNKMDYRIMAFGNDFESLLSAFKSWVKKNGITEKELWFADIFEFESAKHLGFLSIEDGVIYLTGAPSDSKVNPFKRKLGPVRFLKLFFRGI